MSPVRLLPSLRRRSPLLGLMTLRLSLALILTFPVQARGLAPELERKIQETQHRMDLVREKLVTRMAQNGAPFERQEWEALLEPAAEYRIRPADLESLRAEHRRIIRQSRKASREASLLDLDPLRAAPEKLALFCRELPKGGMLHIHPWGTVDQSTAREILENVDPVMNLSKLRGELFDTTHPGNFRPGELDFLNPYGDSVRYSELPPSDQLGVQRLFALPEGPQDFKRFMGIFTYLSSLVFANKKVDPEPYMWNAFLSRARRLNVDYVEVTQNVRPWESWIQGLESWASGMEAEQGVTVRLVGAFNRQGDTERNRKSMLKILALPASPILTGINLLADESEQPALESGQLIYGTLLSARQEDRSDLRMTMHAGELGDTRNLRDAMILGAERIGHGVKLAQDPVALEIARRQGLAVETNLVSNLRLKVADSVAAHPFIDYLRLGLKVSLSTDDEGMFESDISDECELAVRQTDLTYDELKRMSFYSIETSFADEPTRERLLARLRIAFSAFETRWQ